MPEHAQQDDLMKSLVGKLYTVLTAGDDTAPAAKDRFVAWCSPGIPFAKDDLAFAASGPGGGSGDEARQFLRQASDFARLVNLVPDPSGVYGEEQQQATYEQSGKLLWKSYEDALKYSEVASGDLSDEQKQKLDKFRGLLTKKVKNLVTDEEQTENGPVLEAYLEHQSDWEGAALEYNNKRIAAQTKDDPAIVQDWALNADIYRNKVRTAEGRWVAQGYKNEVEQMMDYIGQTTQRDLVLWKQGLLDQFKGGKLEDPESGEFYYSSFVPAGIVEEDAGWTAFHFNESMKSQYERSENNAWSTEGGAGFGLWKVKIGVSGSSESHEQKIDASDFKMSFSLAQVPLSRPWFSPEFLTNTAWRFAKNTGMEDLSDGKTPPHGQLIAYPTTMILARDIVIDFSELHNTESSFRKHIEGGGRVSYGLFSLGGSYKRTVGERKVTSKVSEQGLSVDGIQIIGFKCAILPKSPDPSTDITSWA